MLSTTKPQALPKTIQVSEMLIREIASGRIPDGSRLPTERKMAEDLGIAVGTVRRALAILDEKGLLKRVQGSGNYVQAKPVVESVYSFFRLECLSGGGLPTADVLDVLRLSKPDDMPTIGDGILAHRIRRHRFINGHSAALEEIWLDGRFARSLSANDLSESLYYHFKEALGLVVSQVEDRVSVARVPDWAPDEFLLPVGQPCGFVERIGKAQDGAPAEYSKTWFNPNNTRYTIRQ